MNQIQTSHHIAQAYDVNQFRQEAHKLVDILADQLGESISQKSPEVIPYRDPETELAFWQEDLEKGGTAEDFFQKVLDHSIKVHHPRCIGHQVAVPALMSSLAGFMSDLLSNGTGVYEMGMASNAIEKVVVEFLAKKIGYVGDAAGFITSGGSLANLTALLAARKAKASKAVWEEGHGNKLAVLVSEEAHYCIDRAARILGMGAEGIIKVPVDEQFKIRTDLLGEYLAKAQKDGFEVIALIGCASSTATGSYDDLETLADFAEIHNLWYHVDGAHGGGVVFSKKYKHLARGIERADSVVIDFHKMLMTPSLNTALVFKRGKDSYKTFEQKAQYLWDAQQSPEWYHSGKRTFECTKLMLSIKPYILLRTYGEELFEANIDRCFYLARSFAAQIRNHAAFELAHEVEANIVNFRYVAPAHPDLNELNASLRQSLLESGKFYIVQTWIKGKKYLRTAIMNPLTEESDLAALLDEIEQLALTQH